MKASQLCRQEEYKQSSLKHLQTTSVANVVASSSSLDGRRVFLLKLVSTLELHSLGQLITRWRNAQAGSMWPWETYSVEALHKLFNSAQIYLMRFCSWKSVEPLVNGKDHILVPWFGMLLQVYE